MNKLKMKRKELKLTQTQVAVASGISARGFQEIERGRRIPNVITAKNIATVLGTTVEELFPVFDIENQ